ncbi:GxxExxY protein [Longimicrobium sp.]|uniref:GxxExxY protein n=1 Tax=Longimicrobium sp. TaxID=2029185 RepID=UPI002E36E133|nr:GxxExxY protein [Longimicrobium sp.]HEX6039278.1 GxxExxY protein [Longimicrobium sp.]
MRDVNQVTGEIVDASYRLHTRLGPGLMEQVYQALLAKSLQERGLKVEVERVVSFELDGMRFDRAFRVDLLVEGRVIVELKSVEKLAPVHSKQLLTYLRLLNLPVGLLINFGAVRMKEGVHRIANSHPSPVRVIHEDRAA